MTGKKLEIPLEFYLFLLTTLPPPQSAQMGSLAEFGGPKIWMEFGWKIWKKIHQNAIKLQDEAGVHPKLASFGVGIVTHGDCRSLIISPPISVPGVVGGVLPNLDQNWQKQKRKIGNRHEGKVFKKKSTMLKEIKRHFRLN